MTIKIVIPITPTAQHRARSGKFAHYKDKEQEANERTIESFLVAQRPEAPITGPVAMSMTCYFPIPKSATKKRLADIASGGEMHTKKPDLDNLAKQIKDCMTRMRYWVDDKQVCEYREPFCKRWDDGNGPRWEISLWEL